MVIFIQYGRESSLNTFKLGKFLSTLKAWINGAHVSHIHGEFHHKFNEWTPS